MHINHPIFLVCLAIAGAALTILVASQVAPLGITGYAVIVLPGLAALLFWLRRRS